MLDRGKRFQEFSIKSILFKGRPDWYFCYLKSERIAHVLAVLTLQSPQRHTLEAISAAAAALPPDIAHLAGGEIEPSAVLADIFGMLSQVRVAATQGAISPEHASLLVKEYEQVAERLAQGSHPSPFLSSEDFLVPDLASREQTMLPAGIKDIKDIRMSFIPKGQTSEDSTRAHLILEYIKEKKSASIKDIAGVIRGVSEKTIQRELAALIDRGLIRRVGERRWSQYLIA